MDARGREFLRQCLHCADKCSGDVVSHPLGETVFISVPNHVGRSDYLCVGASDPQATQSLSENGGCWFTLGTMDDLCNFVRLEPVELCTLRAAATSLSSTV